MPIATLLATMVVGAMMIVGLSTLFGIHPIYVMAGSVLGFGAIVAYELVEKHFK